ncbi:MAG TPA: hypothetical protein VHX52_02910 [Steroidobacteraceae bacterium]|jgi:hypothetical protein|nr:hypothetical protein [Steroidobacteraceae bacterium]
MREQRRLAYRAAPTARLGLHGIDTSDPSWPRIVHAFLTRDSGGYRTEQTWDVMGMRATRSDETILEGAFIPDHYIARIVPAGAAGIDQFVLGVFAWGLLGFGNIYHALDRAVTPMAYHPRSSTAWPKWGWPSRPPSLIWTVSPRTGRRTSIMAGCGRLREQCGRLLEARQRVGIASEPEQHLTEGAQRASRPFYRCSNSMPRCSCRHRFW